MSFLKRIGRTLADLITSKKALATIGAIASGVPPKVAITAYVLGQGIADHGKGALPRAEALPPGKNRDLAGGTLINRDAP